MSYVLGAVKRLVPFVDHFARFFYSRTDYSAGGVRSYLMGLIMAKRGAKNIERMEEHVAGFEYQNVHHAISVSPWDHRPVMDEIARQADGLLGGGRRTRLVVDDSGIAKKGRHSVGVARQYCGRAGKIDNCQIAVCTSLASGQQSTLIDIRLYLPKEWTEDPSRCRAAGVPPGEEEFRSKAEIALQSVLHQRSLGIRFDIVSADSGYGSQPALLHGLDAAGEDFIAEVHCDQHVWTQQPWRHRQGKRPGTTVSSPRACSASVRVDQWAQSQPDTAWQRLKVRATDQGWVEVSYLAARVWVCEEEEEKLWWLLAWENPDESRSPRQKGSPVSARRHYALSNAAADCDARRLVADGVERNVVERNFRDAKSELGMADYQTRGWLPWQHHMALVMLAMLFMLREKMHGTPAAPEPALTIGDIVFALERLLPSRAGPATNPVAVAEMLTKRRRKRRIDQLRRKEKTRNERPPLLPDEIAPK